MNDQVDDALQLSILNTAIAWYELCRENLDKMIYKSQRERSELKVKIEREE